MTRAQRIVIVVYCLLVAYCCVWVPWHATSVLTEENEDLKQNEKSVKDTGLGYAWVWSRGGPPPVWEDPKTPQAEEGNIIRIKWSETARPDTTKIALCLLAATALGAAAFLLAGEWRSP
ncbi:hypothetical protein SBA7_1550003 [Candidatus Sulfotelmatobacter sp. SbA7]|nr:hypothetical protein SBA7_1550003 [Candidatus Sulfotelmatobacter sp. SbA7]